MKTFVITLLVFSEGLVVYYAFEKSNATGFAMMTIFIAASIYDAVNKLSKK